MRKIFLSIVFLFCFLGIALASSGGEGGHSAPTKGWVAEDTYRVLNFAILAIGLYFILRKPVAKALDDRIDKIRIELETLKKEKAEVEKKLLSSESKLLSFEKDKSSILEDYKKEAESLRDRIIEQAKLSSSKLQEQAKKNIEYEIKLAKEKLQKEIVADALSKAEAIIKQSIKKEDQDKLLNEYLSKVA